MSIKYEKLLSIAIPTYNRASDIKVTLTNFIEQIKENKLEKFIEIVISDNNSTDNTQDVIQSLINDNQDLSIKYAKNDTNIGLRNIYNVSQLTNAKYAWLCGDDDIYKKNIIKKVYTALESDVDYIFINHEAQPGGINLSKMKNDTLLSNKSDLLDTILNSPGFVSANIFKSEIYEAIPTESFAWPHFERLLNFPQNMKSLIIAESLIIINRPKTNTWFSYKNVVLFEVELIGHIVNSNLLKKDKNLLISIYTKNLREIYIYYLKKYGQDQDINYKQLAESVKEFRKTLGFNFQLLLIQKMLDSKFYCKIIFKLSKFAAFLQK